MASLPESNLLRETARFDYVAFQIFWDHFSSACIKYSLQYMYKCYIYQSDILDSVNEEFPFFRALDSIIEVFLFLSANLNRQVCVKS